MFRVGSELPESYMNGILQALVPLLQELPNALSLTGHTDSLPYAGGDGGYSNWELSAGRANAARRVLVRGGLNDERFLRVIGTASRMPLENTSPDSVVNRRISIIVMTKEAEDAALNRAAVTDGSRILSAYVVEGDRLWVITDAAHDDEGNRQSTCLLLPEEY